MADCDDDNDELMILDPADDSVITFAITPKARHSASHRAASLPRVLKGREFVDNEVENAIARRRRESSQLLSSGPLELNRPSQTPV